MTEYQREYSVMDNHEQNPLFSPANHGYDYCWRLSLKELGLSRQTPGKVNEQNRRKYGSIWGGKVN